MKNILKEIIEEYGINCKRIKAENLEIAGIKTQYNTPHLICYYKMRNIGKTIYFEWDEYRQLAREVIVW